MKSDITCSECGQQAESDSIYCRICGHQLKDAPQSKSADEADLISRSADFLEKPDKGMLACFEYIERYPDSPVLPQMQFMVALIKTKFSFGYTYKDIFPTELAGENYDTDIAIANVIKSGLPQVLHNGIIFETRVSNESKRSKALEIVELARESAARQLHNLLEEAQKDSESLLVGNKTKAQIEGKTVTEGYNDAEIYYQAFKGKDYERALKGFEYLKSLQPTDSYFRNMLGAILSRLGKYREALREFLFGIHLSPRSPNLVTNLMRELSNHALHPSAVEIMMHYRGLEKPYIDLENEKTIETIELYGQMAAKLTASLACYLAEVKENDLSPDAPELTEDLSAVKRPWLGKPDHIPDRVADKPVFISYRRADGEEAANRLREALKLEYPSMRVFFDQDVLVAGDQFVTEIKEELEKANLFLLLIGKYWHSREGRERLYQPDDILCREVVYALRKRVHIIPVLIDNAKMPNTKQLPKKIKSIASLHAEQLRLNHFESDWQQLKKSINKIILQEDSNRLASEVDLEELERMLEENPDDVEIEIIDEDRELNYVPVESTGGEGVSRDTDILGTWECNVAGSGKQLFMRIVIGDQPQKTFSGEFHVLNSKGRPIEKHSVQGEWSTLVDFNANLLLGFRLEYLLDGKKPSYLNIPFHQQIADTYIGTDPDGFNFSSRNVKPGGGF
jgi:tetratricopeptide (TPR) repeat protein